MPVEPALSSRLRIHVTAAAAVSSRSYHSCGDLRQTCCHITVSSPSEPIRGCQAFPDRQLCNKDGVGKQTCTRLQALRESSRPYQRRVSWRMFADLRALATCPREQEHHAGQSEDEPPRPCSRGDAGLRGHLGGPCCCLVARQSCPDGSLHGCPAPLPADLRSCWLSHLAHLARPGACLSLRATQLAWLTAVSRHCCPQPRPIRAQPSKAMFGRRAVDCCKELGFGVWVF